MNIFFLLFSTVLFSSLAQIFMKAAAMHSVTYGLLGVFNIWFIAAMVCMAIVFLCWQMALGQKPIAFLYPFLSLVYVVVPVLSVYLFQETISVKYVIGIFCIIGGICITSLSVPSSKDSNPENSIC